MRGLSELLHNPCTSLGVRNFCHHQGSTITSEASFELRVEVTRFGILLAFSCICFVVILGNKFAINDETFSFALVSREDLLTSRRQGADLDNGRWKSGGVRS